MPHEPQWAASLCKFAQAPEQSVRPEGHALPQVPLLQVAMAPAPTAEHALLQLPHARGLVDRSKQRSVQGVSGDAHDETHPLGPQYWLLAHAVMHDPQVARVVRSVSQPLLAFPSQSA